LNNYPRYISVLEGKNQANLVDSAEIPCFFPVKQGIWVETGSLKTASTANSLLEFNNLLKIYFIERLPFIGAVNKMVWAS